MRLPAFPISFLTSAILLAASAAAAGPEAGLVVEAVRPGSTVERAGLRPGDRLLAWSRPPAPVHPLRSPFDLLDVSIEELPRGAVTLSGRRGSEEITWRLPGGGPSIAEEIEVRPAAPSAEHGDGATAVWLRARQAAAWMRAERWDEADALYEEIVRPLEEAGSPLAPHLLREWGRALLERRARVPAKDRFRRALALDRRAAAESLAVAEDLSGLAVASNQEGAEADLRAALALREKLAPGSAEVAESWHGLGFDAEAAYRLPQAIEHHRRALELLERIVPESVYVARSLCILATAHYYAGDYAAAARLFEGALATMERLAPDVALVATILQGLGMSVAGQGETIRAVPLLERALSHVVRLEPGGLAEVDAARDLGRIERRLGRTANAAEHLCRAVEIVESRRRRQRNDEDRLRWGIYFADAYRDCVSALAAAGRVEEAFHVLEQGRSRSLVPFLAERELRADLPPPLAAERHRLAAEYDRLQASLGEAADETAQLQIEARLREIRWRREELFRAAGPGIPPPEPLTLAKARQALDPGTVFLAYSVGAEETLLFVLQSAEGSKPRAPAVLRIPRGAADLAEEIGRFRRLLATPGSPEKMLRRQGRELYGLLLAPAEPYIAAGERILVSPDGPLHGLPFGALVRKRRYLAEEKPVHAVLSASAYAELRKSRRPPTEPATLRLAAFGDPVYPAAGDAAAPGQGDPRLRDVLRGGLARLPASRREVESLAALFPRTRVFLGAEATEENVKAVAADVRLLHFAVHAVLDTRLANHSALVLSLPGPGTPGGRENGLLQVWEILGGLRLDADLVTLSACRSGLGKEGGGEGLIGLTRAFQLAGARSVVATLWPVADASTADFMKRFYSHLRQGESKDRALQAAQREGARRGLHPFHWAAFQLYGDWR